MAATSIAGPALHHADAGDVEWRPERDPSRQPGIHAVRVDELAHDAVVLLVKTATGRTYRFDAAALAPAGVH